jgi:CDP-diacylglycerol--serine O-phosphatidyltransferase
VISLNQFLSSKDFNIFFEINEGLRVWITFFALVFIGYFMVSRWKFPSLKNLDVRVASFQIVFLTVIGAALIIYGLLTHFALVFFGLSWAYLGIAWILSLVRIIAGKRAKVLEDFEPASEDEEQDL